LAPVRLTTHRRPSFSLTSALLPPGRKVIAQGVSKLATGCHLEGRLPAVCRPILAGTRSGAARRQR
jgi:hypothetical protein